VLRDLSKHAKVLAAKLRRVSYFVRKRRHRQASDIARTVADLCWDRLKLSGWPHVCFREAFVYSQLVSAWHSLLSYYALLSASSPPATTASSSSSALSLSLALLRQHPAVCTDLVDAGRRVDLALLLGGPPEDLQVVVSALSPLLRALSYSHTPGPGADAHSDRGPDHGRIALLTVPATVEGAMRGVASENVAQVTCPLPSRSAAPTVCEFGDILDVGRPVVLRGAFADCPALSRWKDLEYVCVCVCVCACVCYARFLI
jgi:hypothetical protein